jgi:hydroxymethylpyrimidine/phosphomethylpyrimidine kinase
MAKPIALTLGGWDPCGGAGLAADIKTFEMHEITGMGICTGITVQTDNRFMGVEWVSPKLIRQQLIPLLEQYSIGAIKFGIIESLEILNEVIDTIKCYQPMTPIIWDPVLKASAGHMFHEKINQGMVHSILEKTTLITPNIPEKEILFGKPISDQQLQLILSNNNSSGILIKGGHSEDNANDNLITANGITSFPGVRYEGKSKHGSGCVLSAAICANLAIDVPLMKACLYGKHYTEKFLLSSNQLIGYHNTSSIIINQQ